MLSICVSFKAKAISMAKSGLPFERDMINSTKCGGSERIMTWGLYVMMGVDEDEDEDEEEEEEEDEDETEEEGLDLCLCPLSR
jgi:hypothetical protein